MSYFNTTNLSGDALSNAVRNAKSQEDAILQIFLHTRKGYAPHQITELTSKHGHGWPIWSNRRAMTNLTTKGHLIKTSDMVPGDQGKDVHTWKLNIKKHPLPTNTEQAKLF